MISARYRLLYAALALGLIAGGALFVAPRHAHAHGKEVRIVLRCAPSDTARPLEQRCVAIVAFSNDGEPVDGANLALEAARKDKGDRAGPVTFAPSGETGTYEAPLPLPAYGAWTFSAVMRTPAEGRVELEQNVLPPAAGAAATGQARAQLLIRFNGRDVANLAALLAHLVGTLALFAGIGAVAVVGVITASGNGIDQRRRLARWFPATAAAAFALIVASGVYNAVYNAPTRSPGLLDPGAVAGLPYGTAYLAAFGTKMLLAFALLAGTALLAVRLRRAPAWRLPPVAGGAVATDVSTSRRARALSASALDDACVLIAAADLALGGALLITVVVVDYLHLLSHAAVLAG